ncbi:MAG: gentisate 1,2-dioxygenase [Maribacter sp.]|jgi:gentisate 1,2-dioxygenase
MLVPFPSKKLLPILAQFIKYISLSGTGPFIRENESYPFQAHDVLFVPAFQEHRFIDFSDDFQVWVVFYGTKGGE